MTEKDVEYLGEIADKMTPDEQDATAFAINHFGTAGHPMATREELRLFGKDYTKECLETALKSGKTSARFGFICRSALHRFM